MGKISVKVGLRGGSISRANIFLIGVMGIISVIGIISII